MWPRTRSCASSLPLAGRADPRAARAGWGSKRQSASDPACGQTLLPAEHSHFVTSLTAMLIAVPVGLGVAIFLTELCPPRLRQPVGIAIELLAGIPSIIYGIWGLFVLAPF